MGVEGCVTSEPGSVRLKSGDNTPHFALMSAEPMNVGGVAGGPRELCKWPSHAARREGTGWSLRARCSKTDTRWRPLPTGAARSQPLRALAPGGRDAWGEAAWAHANSHFWALGMEG